MKNNNIYSSSSGVCNKSSIFKDYLKKVFDNHYFSNHWEFAIALEEKLSDITKYSNNVTYMNSSVALISMLHIFELKKTDTVMLSDGVSLFPWVMSCLDYIGVSYQYTDNCTEYGENDVLIEVDFIDLMSHKQINNFSGNHIIIPMGFTNQVNKNSDSVYLYDMGLETCFSMTSGAFISSNNEIYADKLRWMRSSYGRTGNVKVDINGNGRFSEVQAAEALSAINDKKHEENIFVNVNSEVKNVIGNNDYVHYSESVYTSGIIFINNPNDNFLKKIKYLSRHYNVLYEYNEKDALINTVLIRVPVDSEIRNMVLSSISLQVTKND